MIQVSTRTSLMMAPYKRDVAAYQRDTKGLTWLQHTAYNKLLDHYYETGRPLAKDLDWLYRITEASDDSERAAVRWVLQKFFTVGDGAYHQKRADKELERSQMRTQTARKCGAIGNAKKTQMRTQNSRKQNAFANANSAQMPEVCLASRGSEIQEQQEEPNSLALQARENLVSSQNLSPVSPREDESQSLAAAGSLGLEGRSPAPNRSPLENMRLKHGVSH
jgi:uncharacterized protein YdaU (DUF1376 family)